METLADFVIHHDLLVILVVSLRLGCINHAILTMRAMRQDAVNIVGWITNCIDPNMAYIHENMAALRNWLPVPCLGMIGHGEKPEGMIDVQHHFFKIVASPDENA